MQRQIYIAGITLFLLAHGFHVSAQVPLANLSTGYWYKLSVTNDGLYRIDYNLMKKIGIDPEGTDPRKIRVYTAGNGMLPQSNAADRNGILREVAIEVDGEADGRFDKLDQILFFGQGPDAYAFDASKEIFSYENNLYSDKNFYFITVTTDNGTRIGTRADLGGGFPLVTDYDDFVFHETESRNELHSGREWFGEQFDLTTEQTAKFDITGIIENSEIKIASHVMAQSFAESSFKVFLNGLSLGEQFVAPIPNSQYGMKGRLSIDTLKVNATTAGASSRTAQELKYLYIKNASGKSIGYLDKFLISFKRKLALNSSQLIFSSARSLENPISSFEVESTPAMPILWDVTDPFTVAQQSHRIGSNTITFSTDTQELKTFLLTQPGELPAPGLEGVVAHQNLRGLPAANLLIIVHPLFKTEALRLAAHRSNQNGISVHVVTTEEIFNEFSGGKQDVTAIRDFARYHYVSYPSTLKNILLFGRCSYDYKDRTTSNTNFVPTYESRNSLSPLETFSSDDYFAFFDDGEGDWQESPAQNHTMEIGVGRISVKSMQEAIDIVDKLIAYDAGKNAYGRWRKEIIFVGDDGDFNIHQGQADQLATEIESNHAEFNTQKVYVDAFKQVSMASGQISPDASDALRQAMKKGALIVNFTGHGSEQVWMQERVLDGEFIANWKNYSAYPLLVTATCEFGRHDDPSQISNGEMAQLKKGGGAIGLVTTSRPVNSSTNFTLNKAFYQSLFEKQGESYKDLGTIFRDTKNKSLSGVANRNFSLLADPSMRLAIPEETIVVSSVKTTANSDTLKALSKIIITGDIFLGEVKHTNFNGTLTLTLFDKEASLKTLGDENSPFTYTLWNNALFRGDASVTNGSFEMEFLMPKNLAYQVGTGKLALYASDLAQKKDASGYSLNFKVGESEENPGTDVEPPSIKLFMGDTTFIPEGTVSSTTQLVATLADESGINISTYGVGNTLMAILDEEFLFDVSDYFTSSKDDFTRGTIIFPMDGLEKGRHTITLKAWDNFNNPSTASLVFFVSDSPAIKIEELIAYPNPFSEKTTIQFSHSHAGEDLEATVTIYTAAGGLANQINFSIPESQYQVTLGDWDGSSTNGTKLGGGIYIMRVSVRSMLDGSKNEQFTKLIILN